MNQFADACGRFLEMVILICFASGLAVRLGRLTTGGDRGRQRRDLANERTRASVRKRADAPAHRRRGRATKRDSQLPRRHKRGRHHA